MPKEFQRSRRIGELIQRELAEMIASEMNDPRVALVTIVAVDVSPDMRVADVRVSGLGSNEQTEAALGALRGAAGFLRRALGRRVELRVTPELRFHRDTSIEKGVALSNLIDRAVAEGETGEREED